MKKLTFFQLTSVCMLGTTVAMVMLDHAAAAFCFGVLTLLCLISVTDHEE